MNMPASKKLTPIYQRPAKREHKGFFYLNDEVVVNSLSALESGKIDEIVSKTTTAREGGFSGDAKLNLPIASANLGANKKSSSEIEEEMVRTRTRFSVFNEWLNYLVENKAIGSFNGWGTDALAGVEMGDTVELRADLSLSPLQTVFRLYIWYAEQAAKQGNWFSQKLEQLKETKKAAKVMKDLIVGMGEEEDQVLLVAKPVGECGPKVLVSVFSKSLIGRLGQLEGKFNIIAQVIYVVPENEEYPVLRLTKDIAPTPLEIKTLKDATKGYAEPAKKIGVTIDSEESVVKGPALILDAIAIYR